MKLYCRESAFYLCISPRYRGGWVILCYTLYESGFPPLPHHHFTAWAGGQLLTGWLRRRLSLHCAWKNKIGSDAKMSGRKTINWSFLDHQTLEQIIYLILIRIILWDNTMYYYNNCFIKFGVWRNNGFDRHKDIFQLHEILQYAVLHNMFHMFLLEATWIIIPGLNNISDYVYFITKIID